MLARLIEAAGIPTILITMMPYFSEIAGTPRTLAVEFPFGQTMGHEATQPRRVLREALDVLTTAETAGTIVHSEETWPVPQKEAYKTWQPAEPSPIIAVIATQLREMMRQNQDAKK